MSDTLTTYLDQALAAARQQALEEAAQLAEERYAEWGIESGVSCDVTACEDIANAIRALKDK